MDFDRQSVIESDQQRDRELFAVFNEHVREVISMHRTIVEINSTALRYANNLLLRTYPTGRVYYHSHHSSRNSRNNPYFYETRRSRSRNNSEDERRTPGMGPGTNTHPNIGTADNGRNTEVEPPTTPPPINTSNIRTPPPLPPPGLRRNIRISSRSSLYPGLNTRNDNNTNTRIDDLMIPEITGFMENMHRLADNNDSRQEDRENRLREFFISATMPFLEGTTAGQEVNNGLSAEDIRRETTIGAYRELRPNITAEERDLNPTLDVDSNIVHREADRCPITWTQFTPNTEVICINRCGHMFTPPALTEWLSRHSTCPTCRCELLPNNDPGEYTEALGREPQPAADPELPAPPPVGIDIRESGATTNIFTNVLRGAPINSQQAFFNGIREATEALTSNVVNNNM